MLERIRGREEERARNKDMGNKRNK